MWNVIYLVVVFGFVGDPVGGATSTPQKDAAQCAANAKYFKSQSGVKQAYCVWGVK